MEQATRTFDLSEVQDALEAWRRVAVVTSARGHDAYRQLLATAGERARTGERAPDAIPWSQLKAELGLAE